MPMVAEWLKLDGGHVAHELHEACEKMHGTDGEVVLDLSSLRRIDPGAIAAIGKLAAKADEKGVKVVLRGVNVEVYKVLKLVKLAPRFNFVN